MPTRKFSFSLFLVVLAVNLSIQRSVLQNTDCSYFSPTYSVAWRYDELSNDIVFNLTARAPFNNSYTAIGFGQEDAPTDVIAVYVRSLQIGLIDGHLAEDGAIESDEKTNVQALQFDYDNGVLSAQFARPIETFDSQDADLGSCITMFLPTEPKEIITGTPLELGESLTKIRVCDIAVTCATKMHNDVLVKRQEDSDIAPVCASGPETQKNRVEWKVEGDLVRFSVSQNAKKGRWWTAIGVGESMSDLTIMMMFAENGKLKKQGIFRTEGKMQPQEVEYADIELKKDNAVVNNGKANFEMLIEKKFFLDRADDQGCFYLQVAILAGQYQPNFNIAKHKDTPHAIQVCNLDGCAPAAEPTQEVDGETEQKGEEQRSEGVTARRPEKTLEEIEESSGSNGAGGEPKQQTIDTINNLEGSLEGSGIGPTLPTQTMSQLEKAIENLEKSTSSPRIGEVADEKPLTGDDAPTIGGGNTTPDPERNVPTSSSSASPASPASPESLASLASLLTSSSSSSSSSTSTSSSAPPSSPSPSSPSPFSSPSDASKLSSMPPVFIVDNKTTEKAENPIVTPISEGEIQTTPKNRNTGCGADHEDLKICYSYFAEYLGKVNEWSERHNLTIGSHMWKACTLLSEVQHVTTMCCTIFRKTCATHLDL